MVAFRMGKARRDVPPLARREHTWRPCLITRTASHLNKQYVEADFDAEHHADLFAQLAVVAFAGDSSQRQQQHPRVLHASDALGVGRQDSVRGHGSGIPESPQ